MNITSLGSMKKKVTIPFSLGQEPSIGTSYQARKGYLSCKQRQNFRISRSPKKIFNQPRTTKNRGMTTSPIREIDNSPQRIKKKNRGFADYVKDYENSKEKHRKPRKIPKRFIRKHSRSPTMPQCNVSFSKLCTNYKQNKLSLYVGNSENLKIDRFPSREPPKMRNSRYRLSWDKKNKWKKEEKNNFVISNFKTSLGVVSNSMELNNAIGGGENNGLKYRSRKYLELGNKKFELNPLTQSLKTNNGKTFTYKKNSENRLFSKMKLRKKNKKKKKKFEDLGAFSKMMATSHKIRAFQTLLKSSIGQVNLKYRKIMCITDIIPKGKFFSSKNFQRI